MIKSCRSTLPSCSASSSPPLPPLDSSGFPNRHQGASSHFSSLHLLLCTLSFSIDNLPSSVQSCCLSQTSHAVDKSSVAALLFNARTVTPPTYSEAQPVCANFQCTAAARCIIDLIVNTKLQMAVHVLAVLLYLPVCCVVQQVEQKPISRCQIEEGLCRTRAGKVSTSMLQSCKVAESCGWHTLWA